MVCPYLTHWVPTAAFWRTFCHDGKISPGWCGWGGAHPSLFIKFTITYKVAVLAPAEWADILTLFHLYQYMYSVVRTSVISRLFWHLYKFSASEYTGMVALCHSLWYSLFVTIIHRVQSYIHSLFVIRQGLSSCILPHFVLICFLFRGMARNGIPIPWVRYASSFVPSCFLFRGMVLNRVPKVSFYFCYRVRNFKLFLFRRMVRNGIPRVCFNFCSTERNSEQFSLPRKGSEWNSERFLFRGTAGIPSEWTICSVYSFFRGIIFLSEIPTPTCILFPVPVMGHWFL
jgi:hypothetical protein